MTWWEWLISIGGTWLLVATMIVSCVAYGTGTPPPKPPRKRF